MCISGRMIAIGFVLGPFNHYWYTFLDKVLKGSGGTIVLKKIACDQAVAGPFFCTSFLFGIIIFIIICISILVKYFLYIDKSIHLNSLILLIIF